MFFLKLDEIVSYDIRWAWQALSKWWKIFFSILVFTAIFAAVVLQSPNNLFLIWFIFFSFPYSFAFGVSFRSQQISTIQLLPLPQILKLNGAYGKLKICPLNLIITRSIPLNQFNFYSFSSRGILIETHFWHIFWYPFSYLALQLF